MKRVSFVRSTMKLWKTAVSILAFVALPSLACPASAADSIKITYAFFQNPVEIPGGKVLPPGNYTAVARGVNSTTGVALLEVYAVQ